MELCPGQLYGNADLLSNCPSDKGAWEKIENEATLIQSVNMGLLLRESIHAAQNQDTVLLQVVMWLETSVRPASGDVEEVGRKLLSYWSQWGRLFLRDGLVCRCWEHKWTAQAIIIKSACPRALCHRCCAPCTTILHLATLASRKLYRKYGGDFIGMACGKTSKCILQRCFPGVEVNDPSKQPKAPLINIRAGHPLKGVAIDIVGPTDLVVVGISNHFTKFTQEGDG